MPKFFKKEKKIEEEPQTPSKVVEKPTPRYEETAAVEDWMIETKTNNSKKKFSEKDKKAAYEERESENTARIHSLEEEKKTLEYHVHELEQNFNRILDLQNEVLSLKSLLDDRDSLQEELTQMTDQYHETKTELEQTQNTLTETKAMSDQLQAQVQDLTRQVADEKSKAQTYQKEVESLQGKTRQLETDKYNLKEKNETLLKERARICAGGKQISDIEKIIDEHSDLETEVETLKAQKKRLNEDLVMTTQKLAITANSVHTNASVLSSNKDHGAEALRQALAQKVELERLVAEMTEYVKSKETQMATVKDVNRQLAEQLQVYRSKYENYDEE